jgi:hypothetical protein
MRMRQGLVVMLCTALAGCASLGASDCSSDPVQLGQSHGVLGANEVDRLAVRCGASFNAERYREGYSDGFSRRPLPLW